MTTPTRKEVARRISTRHLDVHEVGPARVVALPVVEVTPTGRRRWHVLSVIGRWPFTVPTAAAGVYFGLSAGRVREGVELGIGFTLAGVVANFLLKPLVRAPRPPGASPFEFGFGFPSGHASSAFALGTLLPRALLPPGRARRLGVLAGVGFAGLMGLARVRVTAHDWDDVVGGWMVGALAAGAMTR